MHLQSSNRPTRNRPTRNLDLPSLDFKNGHFDLAPGRSRACGGRGGAAQGLCDRHHRRRHLCNHLHRIVRLLWKHRRRLQTRHQMPWSRHRIPHRQREFCRHARIRSQPAGGVYNYRVVPFNHRNDHFELFQQIKVLLFRMLRLLCGFNTVLPRFAVVCLADCRHTE